MSPGVELGSFLTLYSDYREEVNTTIISKWKNRELDEHNAILHWNKDGTLEFYRIVLHIQMEILEMLDAA